MNNKKNLKTHKDLKWEEGEEKYPPNYYTGSLGWYGWDYKGCSHFCNFKIITSYENLVEIKANILLSVYSSCLNCVLSKLYCFPVWGKWDTGEDELHTANGRLRIQTQNLILLLWPWRVCYVGMYVIYAEAALILDICMCFIHMYL